MVILLCIFVIPDAQAQKVNTTSNSEDTISVEDVISSNMAIMPAVSHDGQSIIVKFSNYSCCYYDGAFLRLYDQGQEIQTIQTEPEEDIEWSDADFDSAKVKIERLMELKRYHEMTPVAEYKINDSGTSRSVELSMNEITYQSASFKLDSIQYESSFCCLGGVIEENYDCKIEPGIKNIWIDTTGGVVLLEYGIVSDANGCDRGPFFKIILIRNEQKDENKK